MKRRRATKSAASLFLLVAGCLREEPRVPLALPAEARQCTQFDGAKPPDADARWDVAATLIKSEPLWTRKARTIASEAATHLKLSTDEPGVVIGVVKARVKALVHDRGCTATVEGGDVATYALRCPEDAKAEDEIVAIEIVVHQHFARLAELGREAIAPGRASESSDYSTQLSKLETNPRELVDPNDADATKNRLDAFRRDLEGKCTVEWVRIAVLQGLPATVVSAATAHEKKKESGSNNPCADHIEECRLGCFSARAEACHSLSLFFDEALRAGTPDGDARERIERARDEYKEQARRLYDADCQREGEGSPACTKKAALE